MSGLMTLPPKMAADLAERARRGEGVRISEKSEVYDFAAGNLVSTLMSLSPAHGHVERNPARAAEIRAILSERAKAEGQS